MALLGVAELDRDVFTWVVEHRAAPFDWLFVGLSAAGQAALIWIALAPLLALWARKPVLFTTLVTAATVWTADLLTIALKSAFDRERPYEVVPAADPLLRWDVSSSMPSGHAATSAAGALILAYLLGGFGEIATVPPGRAARPEEASSGAPVATCYERSLRPCLGTTIAPRRRAVLRQPLLGRGGLWLGLLAVAIGFSRVYVGVHYPLDVLVGAAVGLAVGVAAAALVRRLRPTSAARPRSGAGRPEG